MSRDSLRVQATALSHFHQHADPGQHGVGRAHERAVYPRPPAGRGNQPGQHPDRGGLASPVGPRNPNTQPGGTCSDSPSTTTRRR